jgi:hypothetical protein
MQAMGSYFIHEGSAATFERHTNGWAVRFVRHKGLGLCQRTTFAQGFPTDFLEKLIVYQHNIINQCQKIITFHYK